MNSLERFGMTPAEVVLTPDPASAGAEDDPAPEADAGADAAEEHRDCYERGERRGGSEVGLHQDEQARCADDRAAECETQHGMHLPKLAEKKSEDHDSSDDGELRRFVNVYLKGEDIRFLDGLDTRVADGDEVTILPAVAGG